MDMRSMITMEVKKEDRTYIFMMPAGSPFGEVYDVAFKILEKVVDMAKSAKDQARPKEEEQVSPEVVS